MPSLLVAAWVLIHIPSGTAQTQTIYFHTQPACIATAETLKAQHHLRFGTFICQSTGATP